MLKKHSHFGESTAAKVEFVITIESVDFIDVMKNPGSMKVEWSRAASTGKTNKARIDYGGHAVWNQVIDFSAKMYMDKKGLAAKTIVFTVKFIKDDGKSKNAGKLTLNLSDFVNFESPEHATKVSRLIKKDEKMQLKLNVKCVIIKLKLKNNKKLAINKSTGQWEEGADSEWSASEVERSYSEDKTEKSSSGKSKSKKKSKHDDSDSDSDSDLSAAIENYSDTIKKEERDGLQRGNSFRNYKTPEDPFVKHNQRVLGLSDPSVHISKSRDDLKKSRNKSDSYSDNEQNDDDSSGKADDDCKCVLF